jgi:hypothetical protein
MKAKLFKKIRKKTQKFLVLRSFGMFGDFKNRVGNRYTIEYYTEVLARNPKEAAFRYNSHNQISVYTKKVDLAKATSNETLLLVKSGVVLSQNYISFEFSDINSIKPEMLADAIKNARDTASQFAENSGSVVGSVARGNQGVFDITEKDPGSPEYKKIRLVSTLRFLLK